ncbi:hypothetical protein ACO0QE_004416 [Hanseniaspora vineae]
MITRGMEDRVSQETIVRFCEFWCGHRYTPILLLTRAKDNNNNNDAVTIVDVVIAVQDFLPNIQGKNADHQEETTQLLSFNTGQAIYVLSKHDNNKNVWWDGFTILQPTSYSQNHQNTHNQHPHTSNHHLSNQTPIAFEDLDQYTVLNRGWFPGSFVKSVYHQNNNRMPSKRMSPDSHWQQQQQRNQSLNATNAKKKRANLQSYAYPSSRKNSILSLAGSVSSNSSDPHSSSPFSNTSHQSIQRVDVINENDDDDDQVESKDEKLKEHSVIGEDQEFGVNDSNVIATSSNKTKTHTGDSKEKRINSMVDPLDKEENEENPKISTEEDTTSDISPKTTETIIAKDDHKEQNSGPLLAKTKTTESAITPTASLPSAVTEQDLKEQLEKQELDKKMANEQKRQIHEQQLRENNISNINQKPRIFTEEEVEILWNNFLNSLDDEVEKNQPLVWAPVVFESSKPDLSANERDKEVRDFSKKSVSSGTNDEHDNAGEINNHNTHKSLGKREKKLEREKFMKILYYNEKLNCYCKTMPFLKNPLISIQSSFPDEESDFNSSLGDLKTRNINELKDLAGKTHVPSIVASTTSSAATSNKNSAKPRERRTSIDAVSLSSKPGAGTPEGKPVTAIAEALEENARTETSSLAASLPLADNKAPLLSDNEIFYLDESTEISSWSKLLHRINAHLDKAYRAVFDSQPSSVQFQYNLNLVSKYSIYMNNSVRLLQYKLEQPKSEAEKQQRKEIKKLFKILRKSFFIISVNTYLYFNSKKFNYKNLQQSTLQKYKKSIETDPDVLRAFSTATRMSEADQHISDSFNRGKTQTSFNSNVFANKSDDFKVDEELEKMESFERDEKTSNNHGRFSENVKNNHEQFVSGALHTPEQQNERTKGSVSFDTSNGAPGNLEEFDHAKHKSSFRANSTSSAHPALHIDMLVKSIAEEFSRYKSATLQLYKIMVLLSIPDNAEAKNKNPDTQIPQLVPHFFKNDFSGGSWNDFSTEELTSENLHTMFKKEQMSVSTSSSSFPFMSLMNANKKPEQKQHKIQLTRELVANFAAVTEQLKHRAPEAILLLSQAPTMKRNIELTLHTNMVLTTTVTLISQLELLDLSFYSSLKNLDFNVKEDGPEYVDIKKWQQQNLEAFSGILMEFAESKQNFHDRIIMGVMDAQSICLVDPYVFNAMRGELSYEYMPVDCVPKNEMDHQNSHQAQNPSSGTAKSPLSQGTFNKNSVSTLSALPYSPLMNSFSAHGATGHGEHNNHSQSNQSNNNPGFSSNTKDLKQKAFEDLKRLLIRRDVETNSQDYWDCDARLRRTVEKFCENYSVTCEILEQLVELKENFVNTAFRFMSNPKIAALLKDELQHRDSASVTDLVSDYKSGPLSAASARSLASLNAQRGSVSSTNNLSNFSFRGSQKNVGEYEAWYLRNSYDYYLLYDEKGQVKAGTKEALIEHLTSHKFIDPFFNIVMLTTFRSIFSTNEFLRSIMHRYNSLPPEGLSYEQYNTWVKLKLNPIKQNCFNVLFSLFKNYWHEAYIEPGIKELRIICDFFKTDGMDGNDEYCQLFEQKTTAPFTKNKLFEERSASTSFLALDVNKPQTSLKLLEIPPSEFAEQLTLKEQDLYCKINKYECIDRVWNKKYCNFGGSPHIKKFINTSNLITNYITFQIVKVVNVEVRAQLIRYFIDVAERCFTLNNFSSMTAVISGLSSSPVYRLKKTWGLVTQAYRDKLTRLSAVMDSSRNFAKYREVLNHVKDDSPCIPFLGVYLSDLTFTYGGNPDVLKNYEEPMINMHKRVKLTEIVQDIISLQKRSYKIKVYPPVMNFIEMYCSVDFVPSKSIGAHDKPDNFVPDIDYLYEQSLVIEPKVSMKKQTNVVNSRFKDIFGEVENSSSQAQTQPTKATKPTDFFMDPETNAGDNQDEESHKSSMNDFSAATSPSPATISIQTIPNNASTTKLPHRSQPYNKSSVNQGKKIATRRLLFGNKPGKP